MKVCFPSFIRNSVEGAPLRSGLTSPRAQNESPESSVARKPFRSRIPVLMLFPPTPLSPAFRDRALSLPSDCPIRRLNSGLYIVASMSRQQQQQQQREIGQSESEYHRIPPPSPDLASFPVLSPATLPCSLCCTAPPPPSPAAAVCLNPSAASPTCPAAAAVAASPSQPTPPPPPPQAPRKRSSTISTSVVVVASPPSGSSSVPNSGLHADAYNNHKRSHRHSIPSHRLSNYLKFLNELAAKGSSTAQLFSTAVISGSSSAPNLKDMPQPVDPGEYSTFILKHFTVGSRSIRQLTPLSYSLHRESDRYAGSASSGDSPQLFVVAAAGLLPRIRHVGQLQGAKPIAAAEAK